MVALLGLVIGRFLNIIIQRTIENYEDEIEDNIKKNDIKNYPIIEIITAIGCLVAFYHQENFVVFSTSAFIFDVMFICTNIALMVINFKTMLLPNKFTLGGALISLVGRLFIINEPKPQEAFFATLASLLILLMLFSLFVILVTENKYFHVVISVGVLLIISISLRWSTTSPEKFLELEKYFLHFWQTRISYYPAIGSVINSISGAIIGAGLLMILGGFYYALRGIEIIGVGIFKMMLFIGMFLGFQLTLCSLLIAIFIALLILIPLRFLRGKEIWQAQMPFGVCLAISSIISLFYGKQLILICIHLL